MQTNGRILVLCRSPTLFDQPIWLLCYICRLSHLFVASQSTFCLSVCPSLSISKTFYRSIRSFGFFFHLSTLSPVSRFSVVRAGFRIYSRSEHSNRTRVETLDTKTNPFPPGLQWLWGHHRFPEQPSSTPLSKKSFFLVRSCL